MAEQQLIGALEAGGTTMVCATGYADGTVLEEGMQVVMSPGPHLMDGTDVIVRPQ